MANVNRLNRLTRKDFLKDVGLFVLSFGLPWKNISEFEIPSTPVEIAIFEHLNLTPDQCRLSINAGNHSILDQSMEAISSMKPVILTGEQRPSFLAEFLTKNPQDYLDDGDRRNACTDPGIGSSPAELSVNAENLQRFVKTGGSIVTADAEDIVLFSNGLRHLSKDTVLKRTGLGAGAAALLAILAFVKKNSSSKKEGMDMKTALKYAPLFVFGMGVALTTGMLIGQTTDCAPPDDEQATEALGRVPAIEQNSEDEIDFEKFVNKIRGEPPVMGYSEGLIHLRNLEMAYNLWRVVAESVGKGQTGVKIFEKHGNAHGAIEDLFIEGPDTLQKDLKKYMKKIVQVGNVFNQAIKDMITERYIDDKQLDFSEFQEVQNQWFKNVSSMVDYVRFFQETVKVGDDPVLSARKVESTKRPPSARALMFREMIDGIDLAEADEGALSSRKDMFKSVLMVALAEDAHLETILMEAKSKLKGESRRQSVVGEIDLQQLQVLWFDQFMKGVLDRKLYTIEDQLIVGCVEVYGRMCPIVREFAVSQDQVVGVDKVLLGNDQVAMDSKKYYYSSDKPEELPDDFLRTVNIGTNDERTTTEAFDVFQVKDFTETDALWSQNQTDPAKINLIRLIK